MAKLKIGRIEPDYEVAPVAEAPTPIRALKAVQPAPMAGQVTHLSLARLPEDPEKTAVICRVWGDAILTKPAKVEAILRTQSVINEEGNKMLQSTINIGRSLIELKNTLSEEEFNRGLRCSAEAFPGWSAANVTKLIRVAKFMAEREKTLSLDEAPQSYSTLYEFTTLSDGALQQALALRLFRPDVRRSEVQKFKRSIGMTEGGEGEQSPYAAEIARIDQRLATIRREEVGLRKERAQLTAKEDEWHEKRNSATH